MTMESGIRKLIVLEETILNEGGGSAVRPVCRVAGVGVFTNPCSGRFVSDVAMHDLEVPRPQRMRSRMPSRASSEL